MLSYCYCVAVIPWGKVHKSVNKAKISLESNYSQNSGWLVAKSCPTLWDPMGCSRPGFPVLHCLPRLLKLRSIGLVMPSNHLTLCCPLLLLPSVFPSIRVFSSKSALRIRWPKYWSFNFSISPSNEHSGLISLQSKGLSRVFSNTTIQKLQFFSTQPSLWSNSHIHTWLLEKP